MSGVRASWVAALSTWVLLSSCVHNPSDPFVVTRSEGSPPVITLPPPAERPIPEVNTSTGALTLSVEDATMAALRNNRDLRVQTFAPVIAGTFEQIERGVFDPELYASFIAQRERGSQVARATGERFDVAGSIVDAQLGVKKRFSTGTTVDASARHGLDDSNRTPRQQVSRLGLSVTQSLLRGFGPAVNLAAVERAELEFDASVHELEGFAQELVMRTEVAYWELALAKAEIAIYARSFELAKDQQSETEARIEVGLLPPLEAAAARAEVARRNQALIDARSRLEAARLTLARLVAPTETLAAAMEATSDLTTDARAIEDVEGHVALALMTRPELKEAAVRLAQNRLDTVVTSNGMLPRLDFFVALGKSGYASSTTGSVGELGGNAFDVVAGIDLGDMLGHRAVGAADLAARATRRQAQEAVLNLRQLVALEVRLAINEAERARAQIAATSVTRALQEQALAAEKERFDVGTTTALTVAQAQRDLLSSQIDEVRAMVDYRRALVRLYRSEGTLLARRGVVVGAPR